MLFRRIPFSIRVLTGLLVIYGVGLAALVILGPESSGRVWLFSFSIVATLLLGLRAGLTSIVINSVTVLAVGYLLSHGMLNWATGDSTHIKVWTITAVTFVFLNSVVTISLAVLVRTLEKNLVHQHYVAAKLQKANNELKENNEKREKLEAQLIQAQKMESVGRLAGGVAHDFNNMLGVILGHAELAMDELDQDQPVYNDLLQIQQAANRSADITKQLLAFARKQIVSPKVIDLNETVSEMLKMLLRLIGENIELTFLPGKRLWLTKIDPSQVDQILVNLCVNARDAIAGVGKITVETGNCTLDEEYCLAHAGFAPGQYVKINVSDNGRGMDKEILPHIFEPFFTTKEVNEGTGLGLATIYGIVKQNNGFVNAYSEQGQGTTFSIYLPRYLGKTNLEECNIVAEPAIHGDETILLVEDEPTILDMTTTMLQRLGYTVLVAGTPSDAIHLADEHSGQIHLVLTDVIMPEMNGRILTQKLMENRPGLKCLFMSGYTANVISHHGVLDEGVSFIQKPFTKRDLAEKIRLALGQG